MAYPLPTSWDFNVDKSAPPRTSPIVFAEDIRSLRLHTEMKRFTVSEEAFVQEQINAQLHTMRLSPSSHAAALTEIGPWRRHPNMSLFVGDLTSVLILGHPFNSVIP